MKITDEMVQKARYAYYTNRIGHPQGNEHEQGLRQALETIAPLIIEECAKVAGQTRGFRGAFCSEAAVAIRALKEPANA